MKKLVLALLALVCFTVGTAALRNFGRWFCCSASNQQLG